MKWQSLKQIPKNPFDEARSWLIAASAGCGKTFIVTSTIDNLLEQGVPPTEIMYIQYNKAPTRAIRHRYFDKGLTKNDMLWWNTYDSIALRLLKAKRMGLNGILTGKSLQEWGRKHGFHFGTVDEEFHGVKDDRITNATFESLFTKVMADQESKLTKLEARMLSSFEHTALIDKKYPFPLILRDTLRQDLFPDGVKYIFVDEGQDNGVIQLDYYQRILESHPEVKGFMLVGDDKQAINEYRGGSARTFLHFKADRYVTIPKTYRCAPKILEKANTVARHIQERSPIVEESNRDIPGQVMYSGDLLELIPDIYKWVVEGKHVMILQRTRFNLWKVRNLLREHGVPVWSSAEENVVKVLRAFTRIKEGGVINYQDHVDLVPSVEDKSGKGQLKKTAYWKRGFLKEQSAEDRAATYNLDMSLDPVYPCPLERAEEDLGIGKGFLDDLKVGRPRADLFTGDIKEISRIIQSYSALGSDYRPVELSTIHTSKGREADVVVLIRNITSRVEQSERYDTDNERRVWYVACTRARDVLCVTDFYLKKSDIYTQLV